MFGSTLNLPYVKVMFFELVGANLDQPNLVAMKEPYVTRALRRLGCSI
jgi:hypothetical protein